VPVVQNGQEVGTVVTGLSLEPYERTADRAALASVVLALAMLALITVTTRLVVGRALKPVSEMTEEAANWSEHDLDRRFNEGEPTDELTRLAATFDTMLDRMAYMVRHERNFSAELSHELRTPLSAISAEAEIALRKERGADEYRDSLERISERASELTRVLETLLDVARSEGSTPSGESAELNHAIEAAVSAAEPLAERCGVEIDLDEPDDALPVQVGPDTFQRMIAPILENAVTYAKGRVSLAASGSGARTVDVTITDDGAGFTPEDLAAAFEPGHRGSAPRNGSAPAGTGLGLALARRLARANGGEVTISDSSNGGVVVLSLPLAVNS
jgi:signal transduction histidine kinase